MNPTLVGTLVGLGIICLGCLVLAFASRAHRRQLAAHDEELMVAIGVGRGRETTGWIPLIKSAVGRHRP